MSKKRRGIFGQALERELWNHEGKWVAIVDDELVGVGATPGEVAEIAWSLGHDVPLIYRVPRSEVTYLF